MKAVRFSIIILALFIVATSSLRAQEHDLAAIIKRQAERSSVWDRVQTLTPNMTSRELFTYALLLLRSADHLDRLDRF